MRSAYQHSCLQVIATASLDDNIDTDEVVRISGSKSCEQGALLVGPRMATCMT